MSTNAKKSQSFNVNLYTNSDGKPEPQIEFDMPPGTDYGTVMDALHRVAGAVEIATQEGERWELYVEPFSAPRSGGRIFLELAEATAEEAERATVVLRAMVALMGDRPRFFTKWRSSEE